MDMEYKDFVEFVQNAYYQAKQDFADEKIEDWEQVFFDKLDDRFDTDTEDLLAHLYYDDDEDNCETAAQVLEDLMGRKLLRAFVFNDDLGTTVVVAITTKKEA